MLAEARQTGKEGPAAQHLVGAKLALRFPDMKVSNASYSTADDQSGRLGDFQIGDTSFHVLEAKGQLEAWYEFEKRSTEEALREWCKREGIALKG